MAFQPKTCIDCPSTFTPATSGAQKRCDDCRARAIAPDGLARDLVLKLHTPTSSRAAKTVVLTPAYLRGRGRMAEPDPGDYLALVLPFPASVPLTKLATDTPIAS